MHLLFAEHAERVFCLSTPSLSNLCQVKLKHKDTNMYLSSNKNLQFGQPIHGHQEVCGVPSANKDTEWYAAEGVYLPRTDSKKKKADAAKDGKTATEENGKDEL